MTELSESSDLLKSASYRIASDADVVRITKHAKEQLKGGGRLRHNVKAEVAELLAAASFDWQAVMADYDDWQQLPAELQEYLSEVFAWDEWLAEFVMTLAEGNEPPAIGGVLAGGVTRLPPESSGEDVEMVMAIAGPFSNGWDLVDKFRAECDKVFPAVFRARDPKVVRTAEWLRAHREGKSFREIALDVLKVERPEVAASPKEYPKEVEAMRSRIAKAVRTQERLWNESVGRDSTAKD